jgi:hypothetical protein
MQSRLSQERADPVGVGRLAYPADVLGGTVPEAGQDEGAEAGVGRGRPQHPRDRLPHDEATRRL